MHKLSFDKGIYFFGKMIDDWLDNFGHTMIIGATNSGKTTLAKYLLNRRRWRYVWVCSPHKEHKYF